MDGQQSLFELRPRATSHVEVLVEDLTSEVVVRSLLERQLGAQGPPTWAVRSFQGKRDMLQKLPARLRGLRRSLPVSGCVVVLLDADQKPCVPQKAELDRLAQAAGLIPTSSVAGPGWNIANRLAIEEIEAWFLGDPAAVAAAYAGFPADLGRRAGLRRPDEVKGGTWETLERELKRAGHFAGGYRKVEAARAIAPHLEPGRNTSASFGVFWSTMISIRPSAS